METNKQYIGDGVYASFDGYHIVLDTGNDIVYLKDLVYAALVEYARRLGWVVRMPDDGQPLDRGAQDGA